MQWRACAADLRPLLPGPTVAGWPGVGSRFQRRPAVTQMVPGEDLQRFVPTWETVPPQHLALVVKDHGFDFFLMHIQSGKWHTETTSLSVRAGRAIYALRRAEW